MNKNRVCKHTMELQLFFLSCADQPQTDRYKEWDAESNRENEVVGKVGYIRSRKGLGRYYISG
jgi:hypothetical protein